MNFFSTLLAALFFISFALSSHATPLNGQNYVSLEDWGRANGLHAAWVKPGEEIAVANKTSRLVFNVDSTESEINGVNVRLSFPVANAKGTPLIAQFDLDKTVRPLLFPSRYVEPKKITTICLDPGHGGKDSGNRVGWHYEKNYTLPLALELRNQLKKAGFKVILTRSKDTYVDLPERPAIANKAGADLFISLHFNATTSGKDEAEGPETYCITPVGANSSNAGVEGSEYGKATGTGPTVANRNEQKSLLFAYEVQKSLVENLHIEDRDVRRARFAVLRDATMPAILIEGGYMTHPIEGKKIYSSAYQRQMAAAIVEGILAYEKLTAPPMVQPVPPVPNHQAVKILPAKHSL